jgi:hypothetical protein
MLSVVTLALALAAALAGASFPMLLVLQFALPTTNFIGTLLPSSLAYLIFPEGGGPSFVGLVVIVALTCPRL